MAKSDLVLKGEASGIDDRRKKSKEKSFWGETDSCTNRRRVSVSQQLDKPSPKHPKHHCNPCTHKEGQTELVTTLTTRGFEPSIQETCETCNEC